METKSNVNGIEMPKVDRNAELEEYLSLNSYDRGPLNEAELCAAYGFELVMSPTETIMPEGEDELSWFSQTENILTGTEQFDLLETDVFSSQDPNCLDDESLNLTCMVKLEPQMDERNCSCQSQDESIYLNLDTVNKEEFLTDPSPSLEPSQLSIGSSQASRGTEDCLSETTEFMQALTRRMTLSQKMKFYAWFNSGLSIAEAARKSKIPDLIPPPIRHPNCKFSKRRLKRLSKLLPNVFLQRQFVYETYFAGVDPKKIMRSLLIELNSEDLISTFENQFTMEELAIEEKLRQSAANMTVTATVESSRGQANLESVDMTVENSRGDRANLVSLDPMESLNKTVTSAVESPRGEKADAESVGTTVERSREEKANLESLDPIRSLDTTVAATVKSLRREGENWSQDLVKLNGVNLEGDQVMKYCYWRNEGLPIAEALSKAKEFGLADYMAPHPRCSYSWGDLLRVSHSLSDSRSKERFLIDVFYNGEDPSQVLFFLTAGNGDIIQPGISHAKGLGSTERPSLSDNLGLFPINTKTSPEEPSVPSKNKPGLDQEPSANMRLHINDQEHVTDRVGMLPVEVVSELPKMSVTRLTKFYKWCNRWINPSEALAKAKMPGMIPNSVPHPNNRYTWEETKMSGVVPKSLKKVFNAEVFYGGKEPRKVMKNLMPDNVNPNNRFKVDLVSGPPDMAVGYSGTSNTSPEQHSLQSKNDPILSLIPNTGPANLHVATGLPKMSLNQRKKYYKWCNQGISPSEALVKAKVRGLVPKCVPHPSNKYTWEEVKILAAVLPHNLKMMFHTEVFYGGKEPETVMKILTDDVHLHQSFNSNLKLISNPPDKSRPSAKSKNGPILSPIKSTCQSGCIAKRDAKYGTVGDRETITELPELSCNQLKKYYNWCILGLCHEEALSRAKIRGLVPDFSGPHPACKRSWDELKEISSRLPTESARDRFLVHAYHGGNNPYELVETMKANHSNPSQPKTNPKTLKKEDQNELHRESRRHMIVNYLVARGLTQEEALSKLENPSKKLVKELEEFVEKAHLKEQEMLCIIGQDSQPACQDGLESHPESKNVPLGSPDHPSTFLDDRQLMNSNGFSGEDTMKKAKTNGLPMHHLYRQQHLKSQLDFHDVQKMSKLLPTRALAKKFVIETYYGGNDPDKTMKSFESSGSSSCSDKLSQTHELASNPWYSPSFTTGAVKNSILPAEVASTTALAFNGYSYPGFSLQHQSHGYPPREAPAGHSAGISGCAHPSTLIAQEIQPQPMNNTRNDNIKTASHRSEHQSWKDLPQLLPTNEPVLEHQSHSAKNNMSEPPEVDRSHPKLTDCEVKCFIVPTNYPIEFLNEPQMDAIESNILEAILEVKEDDVKPSFKDSFRSNGRYGVICNDEFSVNWLRKYLRKNIPYESASLQLMISEPITVRANAVFPLCKGDDDKKMLKFIEKQNRGLNVSMWSVVQRWNSDKNTIMDLYIDEESAEVIQKGTRISFKLGSAEIFIAKNGSISSQNGSHLTDALPSVESLTCPPLPSSSPIPSPPPPPPPPPPTEDPSVIDTSLKGLLFGSASKSIHQDHAQHDSPYSRERSSSPDGIHRKRGRRHRSSSEDRRRPASKSSSLDSIGRSIQKLSKKMCKRRRSRKVYSRSRDRRRSSSKSRGRICKKKRLKERRRRHASRSPIYGGRSTLLCKKDQRSDKSKHPARSMSPISSESNFSTDARPPVDSRLERASSCENTEYMDYLR